MKQSLGMVGADRPVLDKVLESRVLLCCLHTRKRCSNAYEERSSVQSKLILLKVLG